MTPSLRRWLGDVASGFEVSVLPGGAQALPEVTEAILSVLRRAWDAGEGRLIVSGKPCEARPFLPDFSTWHAVAHTWRADCFWILNDVHRDSVPLWDLGHDLLCHLECGLPVRPSPAGIDLVLGHYDWTPFGVHRDAGSNIMWCLYGERQLRMWNDLARSERPALDATDAADHRLAPGDALYWPSSAWHVGRSPTGFSAALNLSLWLHEGFAEFVARAAAEVAPPGEHVARPDHSQRGLVRPPELAAAVADFAARLAERSDERWLAHIGSHGLGPRPLAPFPATPRLRAVAPGRLSCVRRGDELCWGGHGHVDRAPFHPELHAAFLRLAGGEAFAVDDLVGLLQVDRDDVLLDADDARAVLHLLQGWGLLVPAEENP